MPHRSFGIHYLFLLNVAQRAQFEGSPSPSNNGNLEETRQSRKNFGGSLHPRLPPRATDRRPILGEQTNGIFRVGLRCAERGTDRRPIACGDLKILGGKPRPVSNYFLPSFNPFQPKAYHLGGLGQNESRLSAGSLFPRSEGLHPSLGDVALAGL